MDYRNALITGASSGIGEALGERLADEGLEVILTARRQEELERIAADIRDAGGRARVEPLDVSDAASTTHLLTRVDDELGGVDLVVANAGVGREVWSGKLTWADCETIIAVNVAGAVATLTALLPRMVERGRGHLVGVSSLAGYRGLPKNAAYSASKAFLSTFLESVRVDVGQAGVAVTDVRPGFVETPMTAKNTAPMPWLVSADRAADAIFKGIRRKDAVVAFPWQLASVMRTTTVMPASVWDLAIRRARGG